MIYIICDNKYVMMAEDTIEYNLYYKVNNIEERKYKYPLIDIVPTLNDVNKFYHIIEVYEKVRAGMKAVGFFNESYEDEFIIEDFIQYVREIENE